MSRIEEIKSRIVKLKGLYDIPYESADLEAIDVVKSGLILKDLPFLIAHVESLEAEIADHKDREELIEGVAKEAIKLYLDTPFDEITIGLTPKEIHESRTGFDCL